MSAQFRWATGTVTKAALLADTSAPLTAWSYLGRRWAVDIAPVIDRYVEEAAGLGGTVAQLGKINFTVSFMGPNAAMMNYIATTYFAGGVRTAPQTLQVFDLPEYAGQWITVNCTGRLPGRKAELLQPRNGRIPYYTIEFFNGTIAAAGA